MKYFANVSCQQIWSLPKQKQKYNNKKQTGKAREANNTKTFEWEKSPKLNVTAHAFSNKN